MDITSTRCYDGVIAATSDVSDFSITSELRSLSDRIDLSDASGSFTLNGARIDASGYAGSNFAIDLSGFDSITFMGANTIDAGSRRIALPSGFRIEGMQPSITGSAIYNTENGDYTISSNSIVFESTATGDITTSSDTLTISNSLASTSGRIDLSGASNAITLNAAALSAPNYIGSDAAIDLSGTTSLSFVGSNFIDVGAGYVFLPNANSIIGDIPLVMGNICYDSAFMISGSISSTVCYSDVINAGAISSAVTVSSQLRSLSNKVDLSDLVVDVTFNGASVIANNYTGDGVAIDISNADSIRFIGSNSFDAGENGIILLPPEDDIAGNLSSVNGQVCYDSTYQIVEDITGTLCYSRTIGAGTGSFAISNAIVQALSGRINLSGATGDVTIDSSTLIADNHSGSGASIDLSRFSSLTFTGDNTLDSGTNGVSLPSGFRISGALPSIIGNVSNRVEPGGYIINQESVIYDSIAVGTITTSLARINISADMTSVTGEIDFSDKNITLVNTILDASGYTGSDKLAINLGGSSNITFQGQNTINVGEGNYILMPTENSITGDMPEVTGTICRDIDYVLSAFSSDISSCSGSVSSTAISLTLSDSDIIAVGGTIDLSNVSGEISIAGTLFEALSSGRGNAIDLSGASRFICTDSTLDAGDGIIKLPARSNVEDNGCTINGSVEYASETVEIPQTEESSSSLGYILGIGAGIVGAFGIAAGMVYYQYNRLAGMDFRFHPDLNIYELVGDNFDLLEDVSPLERGGDDILLDHGADAIQLLDVQGA